MKGQPAEVVPGGNPAVTLLPNTKDPVFSQALILPRRFMAPTKLGGRLFCACRRSAGTPVPGSRGSAALSALPCLDPRAWLKVHVEREPAAENES